jgi:hypothetical protein
MEFIKRDVIRAIEQFNEASNNLIGSDQHTYSLRINQFFKLIETNHVLNSIISPFLQLEIDQEKYGFKEICGSAEIVLPEDEDAEIGEILRLLRDNNTRRDSLIVILINVYPGSILELCLQNFFLNCVRPAFNKLERRLRYKQEDLKSAPDKITDELIRIIQIGKIVANNSQVAIGSNIEQSKVNDPAIFTDLISAITDKVPASVQDDLIRLVKGMEASQSDKTSFSAKYNDFIIKAGSYMSIIGPFLPALTKILTG